MNYCSKCGDTGYATNGKHCTCAQGRVAKAKDRAEERAKEAAKKAMDEAAKKVADDAKAMAPVQMDLGLIDKKEVKKERIKPVLEPGAWVVIDGHYIDFNNGTLCEVLEIKGDQVKVKAVGKNSDGMQMKGKEWFRAKYIHPAPVEPFDETELVIAAIENANLKRQIDAALDAGNKELFLKLTEGMREHEEIQRAF